MRRARWIFAAIIVVVLAGGLTWALLSRPEPEPMYQGKPLSYWLEGFDQGYSRGGMGSNGPAPPTWKEASDAIKAMGTNAVPDLLRIMRRPDYGYGFKWKLWNLLRNQRLFKINLPYELHNITAVHAFGVLREKAGGAVPQLVEIFQKDTSSAFVQQAIPAVLGDIGPAAAGAVPVMLQGIHHTNGQVRANCIYALRRIHAKPEQVVPALIQCLQDTDTRVRAQAVAGLGDFGPDAKQAIPALEQLAQKEPPSTNGTATGTGGFTGVENWCIGYSWAVFRGGNQPDIRGLATNAVEKIEGGKLEEDLPLKK